MLGWLKTGRRAKIRALMPPPEKFAELLARFPALAGFSDAERERLRELAAELLATKSFHGAGGLDPGYDECLAVATLAAVPVLTRGLDWYGGFSTFILQPRPFLTEIEEMDDETGVVHRGRDLRSGEAWHRGPVVLALDEVWQSGMREGYNVVVHELAHQLDHAGGDADGFPPLPREVDPRAWTREFSAAFERLQGEIGRDEEPFMDPYGTESPAEFFAVSCEYFFDVPEHLRAECPGLYRVLCDYFGQDPGMRMED